MLALRHTRSQSFTILPPSQRSDISRPKGDLYVLCLLVPVEGDLGGTQQLILPHEVE